MQDVLQPQIDRQLHRFLPSAQTIIKAALDAGLTIVVDPGKPDDMRQQRAIGIDAALLMLELQPGKTELIDCIGLVGGQMPLDPDKPFARGQLGINGGAIEPRQGGGELLCGIGGVKDLPRIGVKRRTIKRRSEQLALTIDNVGAPQRRWRRRFEPRNSGHANPAWQ